MTTTIDDRARAAAPASAHWRTRGRPHPVYVYGGLALIAVKLLNWPISETAAWHAFAGGILAMAQ